MTQDKVADFELTDLLELFKRDTLLSLNCHAIGQVKKFDASEQTCEVKISYDRRYIENTESGGIKETKKPYPLLIDLPVICLRGGTAGLTLPIKKDDSCLVLFNDRDIDNWFEGKKDGFVRTPRLHSMSDGVAIVGLSSKDEFIENYDELRASLYNGTTRVAVGEDKILIENATLTLNTILQELVTAISTGVTETGGPFNSATISAINLAGAKLGELLE